MDSLRLYKVTGEIDIYLRPPAGCNELRRTYTIHVVCHDEGIAMAVAKCRLQADQRNLAKETIERVADTVHVVNCDFVDSAFGLRLFKVTGEVEVTDYAYGDCQDERHIVGKRRVDASTYIVCQDQSIALAVGAT